MARAFQVPVYDADKTTRDRSLLCHKIACMVIGALTALAAMAGLAVSVSLLTLGMRPLHDVAALWAPLRNATAHPPPGAPAPAHTNASTDVFVRVVGFVLTALGVPDTAHVVLSIELMCAAWQGGARGVGRWLRWTRWSGAAHAGCALLLGGALLALGRRHLAALALGALALAAVVLVCFVTVVHRFHVRLLCRSSPTVVFTRVRADPGED